MPLLLAVAFLMPLHALTLEQALAEALGSHPLLAVSANRIESAAGKLSQAGLRPNPLLVYQTEDFRSWQNPGHRFWQDADHFLYLQQTFETASKRARRMDLANAQRERANIELLLQKQIIAARVRAAYWDAAGAVAREKMYQKALAELDTIVEYHRNQVKEGAMAEADLLRVELEEQKLQLLLSGAALDAQREAIRLQREMGRGSMEQLTVDTELETVYGTVQNLDPSLAESKRAEALLARQVIQVAGAQTQLENALATPNVDGVGGYKRSRTFDTVIWGVQTQLPLLNRNQGNIASATAEERLARNALASTLALIRAETAGAAREVLLRRQQLAVSVAPLRQRAVELFALAQQAYRLGGADLLRLLDAQRNLLEAEQLHLGSLVALRLAEASLESAVGVLP